MTTTLKTFVFAGLIALMASGCHPRPQDAADAGFPGPVRQVDLGGVSSSSAAVNTNSAPRVVPIRDWVKPAVPLIEPPQVLSIWFYPRKSIDGLSYREGFWCHRVIRAFTWGQERVLTEQGVNLDNGLIVPDKVTITPGEQTSIDPQLWFIDSIAHTGAGVPTTLQVAPTPGQIRTIPSTAPTGAGR